MEEMNAQQRPVNPRRKKKSQFEIFKESYLPVIIAGVAVLIISIFIVGSVVRAISNGIAERQESISAAEQQAAKDAQLQKQAQQILTDIATLAKGYDYEGAIKLIDDFEGELSDFPELAQKRQEYQQAKDGLIGWGNPNKIPNLSVEMLIADPQRAYTDKKYANSFTKKFLTIDEFTAILDKLYANGYVLVSMSDVFTQKQLDGGSIYNTNTIFLPADKKPFILTQTNVNYHTYLTDSDGDKLPDGGGRGFASKLIIDENGQLKNEYIDASGQMHVGNYDMIPILNDFIAQHPDFSYRGARAVIALTGYDGLFGYRTNSEAERHFGTIAYEEMIEQARTVGKALVDQGYELACYTFENTAYGNFKLAEVEADLSGWISEVSHILPNVNIFVYAQNSDIAKAGAFYNDQRFTALSNAGFSMFLGFATDGDAWNVVTDSYIRQSRLLLTPQNIKYHSAWFDDVIDASVLDPNRPKIPQY